MYPRKKTLAQRHPCSSVDECFTLAWFRIRGVDLQWHTRMQTPSGSTVQYAPGRILSAAQPPGRFMFGASELEPRVLTLLHHTVDCKLIPGNAL